MKRIIFLNRFFAPDHSATSQILGDMATHLADAGHDVHVVTSREIYDNPHTQLSAQEFINGVHVHRVRATRFGRAKLIGRAIDYISYYILSWRALRSLVKEGDTVVAMTDPPLISVIAMLVAKRRGAHLINWLQDIYPEIASELGVPFIKGPVARTISHVRNLSLDYARMNVVVGQRMAERVASFKIPPQKIRIIHNWSDDDQIVPVVSEDNPLRREWGLHEHFVFGYSGNLGRAHEFDTVLATAETLRDNPTIVFLFVGGGHQLRNLAQHVKDRGLTNFRFIDYQDRSVLKYSLCVPDAHWISLRPALEGLIVPSKFYGIAAAGRPIVAICKRGGEIATMVERHHCGFVIEPGNFKGLTQVLLELSSDASLRAVLGTRARAMLDASLKRDLALGHWQRMVEQLD